MANYRIVTIIDNGTWYEVRSERDEPTARFRILADAQQFLATGVYPPGMNRSDGDDTYSEPV